MHSFLLHRLVMCFQIKAFREELKLLQAALRAFPAALRSLQEALGHSRAAQGKCACCCKCSCQRRRPHPCPSPHTLLLLLLLQGSAKHRSGHYEKVHCAAIMVLKLALLSTSHVTHQLAVQLLYQLQQMACCCKLDAAQTVA